MRFAYKGNEVEASIISFFLREREGGEGGERGEGGEEERKVEHDLTILLCALLSALLPLLLAPAVWSPDYKRKSIITMV